MIKLGYEMQFRLVRLRNRVRLRGLLGIEMHLRLVVSRLTICARRRRLGCSVLPPVRLRRLCSVTNLSLYKGLSSLYGSTNPPNGRFTPGDAREESRQQTKDAQ